MTKLLEKAFNRASKLPQVEQNALAKWLIEELDADRGWERTFADSEDALEKIASEALDDHAQGKTTPLDPAGL